MGAAGQIRFASKHHLPRKAWVFSSFQEIRSMFAKRLQPIVLVMTFFVAGVQAQTPAPAPANNQPSAQQVQQNLQMVQAATEVTRLIDQQKMGEVWDGASTVAKQVEPRDTFTKRTGADRQALGNLISRQVATLYYKQSDGKEIPVGLYANVAFASRFPNAKQAVRELVSFHLDNDHVWRVSGYTLH
jgi:hypothetical protein